MIIVLPPFHTDGGRNLRFGRNVFVNHGCTAMDLGGIDIGDDVMIGPNVQLISSGHPLDPQTRRRQITTAPVRIARGLRLAQQRVAFQVRLQHDVDQGVRPIGSFLRQTADAPARWNRDRSGLGRQITADRMEEGGFPDTVASDKAHAGSRRDLNGAAIDQQPARDPDGDVVEGEHGRVFTRHRRRTQPVFEA